MQQPVNVVVQQSVGGGHGGLVRVGNRNKWAAVLICWFLGAFGGHKFYLGNTGAGIMYLLFSWTMIPAFIAFIETIMLAVMSEQEFDLKYNSMLAR